MSTDIILIIGVGALLFVWLRYWMRRPIVPAPGPYKRFDEEQLDLALAHPALPEPSWAAILQLIDTAEANANEEAAEDIHQPTVMAGYVGGAKHLRILRQELENRRAKGLELLGRVTKVKEARKKV